MARGLLLAALCMPGATTGADPDAARRGELEHMLIHDCGACHGMRLTGGLGPALTRGAMSGRPEAVLEQVIAAGVPGTPMPPWLGILNRDEIRWMARRLRAGSDRE